MAVSDPQLVAWMTHDRPRIRSAALDLLTGLPAQRKASHLEPGAGHYGIFAGKSWRNNIRPLVFRFMDDNPRHSARPGLSVVGG